jgi:F-type H+-transporting ATPase subunit c
MKNTRNLLLLTTLVLIAGPAFAQEAAGAITNADRFVTVIKETGGWLAIGAGFGIAIAAFGGVTAQGRAAAAALEGIARNPAAAGKLLVPLVLSLALIESLIIFTFLIANKIAGILGSAFEPVIEFVKSTGH